MQRELAGCQADHALDKGGIKAHTIRIGVDIRAGGLEHGLGLFMQKIHTDFLQNSKRGLMDRFEFILGNSSNRLERAGGLRTRTGNMAGRFAGGSPFGATLATTTPLGASFIQFGLDIAHIHSPLMQQPYSGRSPTPSVPHHPFFGQRIEFVDASSNRADRPDIFDVQDMSRRGMSLY